MKRMLCMLLGPAILALALSNDTALAAQGGSDRSLARAGWTTNPVSFGSGYHRAGGSDRVRKVQRRLIAAGQTPGPVDGLFGPRTDRAVRQFQRLAGLQIDGIIGPVTLAALRQRARVSTSPSAVRSIQLTLDQAGYAPGPVDGRFGPRTALALREFQSTQGLRANGIPGPRTLRALKRIDRREGDDKRRTANNDSTPRRSRTQPADRPAAPSPTTLQQAVEGRPAPTATPANDVAGDKVGLWIGVLLAGLISALAATTGRRVKASALVPLDPPLYVQGRSADDEIGEFRGLARAIVPEARASRSGGVRYVVDDPSKPAPVIVRLSEMTGRLALPVGSRPPQPERADGQARASVPSPRNLQIPPRIAAGASIPAPAPAVVGGPEAVQRRWDRFTRNGSPRPAAGRPRVSVIIPTLNEEKNLPGVLQRLPRDVYEVIIVDGHSRDGTLAVARSSWPGIRIITQEGRGKGNALACGFKYARGDVIVMVDADGSADPAEIPRFVQALERGADFAKGSRFVPGGGSADITRLRRAGNWCLSRTVNVLYDRSYTDLCYGFNAFWRRLVPVLNVDCDGFEVETLLHVRAAKAGLLVTEVPSYEHARGYGTSNLHVVRDGCRVLRTIVVERVRTFATKPEQNGAVELEERIITPAPADTDGETPVVARSVEEQGARS
jgi:peptidoglycan hydrolase-like protein with peptidoglycan-binding domain